MTRRDVFLGGAALTLVGAGAAYAVVRNMGSLRDYEDSVAVTRAALRQDPGIGAFLRYATLAASGHNTKPWRFRATENQISILPDFSRRTPIVDPDDHHLFLSLGCAAENLALACSARGHPGEASFDPSNDGALVFSFGNATGQTSPLFDAIATRQSSRSDYDGEAVSNRDLQTLTAAAAVPGVDLVLMTDRPHISQIRDLVIAGNSTQMADTNFVRELRSWIRFSPRQALQTGDGLFSATTGNPILPTWLGPIFFDLAFKVQAENDKYARQISSSAGIAVFTAQKEDHEHWVLVGRACQRFALQATILGLKHAFINQPVEVPALRPALAALSGFAGRRPDIVMRFGYGPALPFSARRAVKQVIA